jgi:hypothetical protein
MKYFLLLWLFFCSLFVQAQSSPVDKSKRAMVYYTSADVLSENATLEVKKCDYLWLKDKVQAQFSDGTKKEFEANTIWGYKRKRGLPTRWYEGELYDLCYYKEILGATIFVYRILIVKPLFAYYKYYYSTSLNSDIKRFRKESLQVNFSSAQFEAIRADKYLRRRM